MKNKKIYASNRIYANKTFNKFLKLTFGKYLIWRFKIQHKGTFLKTLKPPYIILANHTNSLDPFILSLFVPDPIYFVASSEYFRNPFLRFLLKRVGAIPKSKFLTDSSTVKLILNVRNNNRIIGIFPEGARNWDGKTIKLLYPTAKLIKSAKLPVVTSVFAGAYLSKPRWSKNARIGKITITSNLTLKIEEIKKLDVDEIYEVLTEALYHDEYEYQKKHMIPFTGKNLAESLELFIFVCPNCKKICTLKSNKDLFKCMECGYTVRFDKYGFLCKVSDTFYYDRLSDWNHWQTAHIMNIIAETDKTKVIFKDNGVILSKGTKFGPLSRLRLGELSFYKDRFVFDCLIRRDFVFYISRMNGINVQYNHTVEFYYDNILYRFNFKMANTSAYKWVKTAMLVKEMNEETS